MIIIIIMIMIIIILYYTRISRTSTYYNQKDSDDRHRFPTRHVETVNA